ncbi:MAG: transporter substrate-binding domain-containing protein [Campylobacterales bacterium]|nr:transporter substrate-binding domain-containing protein [Campylobacterales bacterium]
MKLLNLFLLSVSLVCAQTIKMTSLEWPPYSGKELPEQGLSVAIAKRAFAAMGYTLEMDFYPWRRALLLAGNSEEYHGYLPEYRALELDSACLFSHSMGKSHLGMVERKNKPLAWESVADLGHYTIGTVQGYVNTHAFDTMANQGLLRTEASVSDVLNIKKVLSERIDAAIIDRDVLAYFLATDSTFADQGNLLQFHSKLLEEKDLHACFQKNEKGRHLAHIFNQGLEKIDITAITKEYFISLGFSRP